MANLRKEEARRKAEEEKKKDRKVETEHEGGEGGQGGAPSDPEVKKKRDKVREMMKHAWDNYEKYAWGANELRPISKRGHSASIFGSLSLGATIIDAADTLYIMELMDEYQKARAGSLPVLPLMGRMSCPRLRPTSALLAVSCLYMPSLEILCIKEKLYQLLTSYFLPLTLPQAFPSLWSTPKQAVPGTGAGLRADVPFSLSLDRSIWSLFTSPRSVEIVCIRIR